MDYTAMVTDSVEYAKEALNGKWVRWITFIVLALPMALVQFVFDPEKVISRKTGMIAWELIPWDQLAVLMVIGMLFGFFLAGYMVRVFRGAKPAPDFDNWAGLFIDGVKLNIVWFLWFLPSIICMLAGLGMLFARLGSTTGLERSMLPVILFALLLFLAACVLALIASLFSYLGSVRFARTCSIREGIRLSEILVMIRAMGWFPYIIALLILCALSFIFGIITMVLSIIPFIGWVLILVVNPFFTLLAARYAVLVYGQGEVPAAAAVQE